MFCNLSFCSYLPSSFCAFDAPVYTFYRFFVIYFYSKKAPVIFRPDFPRKSDKPRTASRGTGL